MGQETQFPPPPNEIKALTLLGGCPMSGDHAKCPACILAKTIYVTFAHFLRQNSIYLSTLLSEERLNPRSRSLHTPRYYSLHKTPLLHTFFFKNYFGYSRAPSLHRKHKPTTVDKSETGCCRKRGI